MINILKLNTKAVYAIGDLHGEFNSLSYFVKTYNIENSIILVCGDVGMGFNKKGYYKQTFSALNKDLKKRNTYILFIRGNHDDPECFKTTDYNTKFIKLIPDYTVIEVFNVDDIKQEGESFNILAVGGAISIDRKQRIETNKRYALEYSRWHSCSFEEAMKKLEQKCYWENETPYFDYDILEEIKNNDIKIEVVATHTCPHFCVPYTKDGIKGWLANDYNLEADIDHERQTMTNLYNKLVEDNHPLKEWVYGHYHFHATNEIDGVMFKLLDMVKGCSIDFACIKDFDKI